MKKFLLALLAALLLLTGCAAKEKSYDEHIKEAMTVFGDMYAHLEVNEKGLQKELDRSKAISIELEQIKPPQGEEQHHKDMVDMLHSFESFTENQKKYGETEDKAYLEKAKEDLAKAYDLFRKYYKG